MDATPHIIESALLLLATFLVGCIIGHFARRISGKSASTPVTKPVAAPLTVEAPSAVIDDQSPSVPVATPAPVAAETTASLSPVKAKRAPARATKKTAPTPDDLKKIKGIGPRLEQALNAQGVTRYAQIAKWSKKKIAELDAELALRGRIERDQWVEQAKALSQPASKA